MQPIFIDVEAAGFGRGSYPIEVGLAMPDGQSYCYLIRPEPEWTFWDDKAEAVHAISRDILQHHGRPARETRAMAERAIERVGLVEAAGRRVAGYSKACSRSGRRERRRGSRCGRGSEAICRLCKTCFVMRVPW